MLFFTETILKASRQEKKKKSPLKRVGNQNDTELLKSSAGS